MQPLSKPIDKSTNIPIDPAGRDPIIALLLHSKGGRLFALWAFTILIALLPILLSIGEGTFINSDLQIDALHDIGYYNQFFLLLPFMVFFTRYYFLGFRPALEKLRSTGIVTPLGDDKELISTSETSFNRKALSFIPLGIGIAVATYGGIFINLARRNTWNSPSSGVPTVATLFSMILPVLLYYLVAAYLLRLFAVFSVVRTFLKDKVHLQPLHPDKCGGLLPLGAFSLRITFAGLAVGLMCLVGIYADTHQYNFGLLSVPNLLLFIPYVVGLSIAFFLPLWPARKAMREAKKKQLDEINEYYQRLLERKIELMKTPPDDGKLDLEGLEDARKLYDMANAMPVFPFNTENVVRFSASILWPILLIVIERLIKG